MENTSYSVMFRNFLKTSIEMKCLCYILREKEPNAKNSKKRIKVGSEFDNHGAYLEDSCSSSSEDDQLQPNSGEPQLSCDMSCTKKLKELYDRFSARFEDENGEVTAAEMKKFKNKWKKSFLKNYPECYDCEGYTIFHYAATNNKLKLFKCAIKIHPNGVHLTDMKGMTVLVRACQRDHMDFIKFLLENTDTDPNGSALCQQTPLMIAVMNKYEAQVKLLLAHGAKPSLSFSTKMSYPEWMLTASPLRTSIVYKHFNIMSMLLKYGADWNELFLHRNAQMNFKIYYNYLRSMHKLDDFKFVNELNAHIENVNVYRLIFFAFFKVDHEMDDDAEIESLFVHFVNNGYSLSDKAISSALQESSLFKLIHRVFDNGFYEPKSLKELSRFKVRRLIFDNKKRLDVIQDLNLPGALKAYLSHGIFQM